MTEDDKRLVRISSSLKKYEPSKYKRLVTRGLVSLSESKKAIDWISNGFKLSIFPNEFYEEALKAFNKAIEIEPNNTYAWWYKGFALLLLKRYEEALVPCNKIIELNSKDDSAWINKGWALYKLGRLDESLGAFIQAKDIKTDDPDMWLYIGFILRAGGHLIESLIHFNKAIEIAPSFGCAWLLKGIVLSMLGRHKEAESAKDKAMHFFTFGVLRYLTFGEEFIIFGYYIQRLILKSHEKMTELKPEDFEVWYNKGFHLTNYEETFEDGLEPFKKAVELKPDDANTWYHIGWVLDKIGNFEESLEASEEAIGLKSDFLEDAWYNKGNALFSLGRYDEALEAFNKAIELKTTIDDAMYKRACIFSLKGDKERALRDLSKAIAFTDFTDEAKEDVHFRNLWDDEDFKKIVS